MSASFLWLKHVISFLMKKNFFILLFLLSVIGVLTGILFHNKYLDYIFKPLIMITIGGHFLLNSNKVDKNLIRLAILAFLFSLFGDSFLMFADRRMSFFILGLASFLIAQISYIFLFAHTIKIAKGEPFSKRNSGYLYGYILYGFSIYILLFNHLDLVLKIAVFMYMLALLGMSAMALNRFKTVSKTSFSYVFYGSVLFVISDSVIAVDKFLVSVPNDRLLVMSTYISAQFLIMKGILKQFE